MRLALLLSIALLTLCAGCSAALYVRLGNQSIDRINIEVEDQNSQNMIKAVTPYGLVETE